MISTLAMLFIAKIQLPKRKIAQENDSLGIFSRAIELRYPGQRGLSDRVVELGLATASELKLDSIDLRNIETAALVRDIGLCAVPWAMVNYKGKQNWTTAEFATYDQRLLAGAAMLEKIPTLKHLAPILRAVYEICPSAPAPITKRIPVSSMVLGVVERYLITERLADASQAKEVLAKESGIRYDPKVVEAFFRVLPVHSVKEKVEAIV